MTAVGFGEAVCECMRFGNDSKLEITVQLKTVYPCVLSLAPFPSLSLFLSLTLSLSLPLPFTHFAHAVPGSQSHAHDFHAFFMAEGCG